MAFDLPFDFNTYRETRMVLKGTIALLVVMLVGGAYMLIVRDEVFHALGTLAIDAMLVAFALLLRGYLPGAKGRLTRDAVVADAERVWGVPMRGPVGTFAMQDFRAVRAERVWGAMHTSQASRPFERVTLVGKAGTPDVQVLRAPLVDGRSAAETLASTLGLPCEVERSKW